MPGCVLRIGGTFAAADLLAQFPLPHVTRADDGCVLVLVSSDEDADLSAQAAEAEAFLAAYGGALREAMHAYALSMELDFGVWLKGAFVQSVRFPAALTSATGNLGIVLCASMYAPADDED
jgi:hypothetical protein